MTTDTEISTTLGTAYADLRDKVGGMTNWSIKDDSSGGASSLSEGEWFVWTTPTGEDIRFYVEEDNNHGNAGFWIQYGPDWDATNDTWNDRYSNDPHNSYHSEGTYSTQATLGPMAGGNNLTLSDNVLYWLAYADAEGFTFYMQREEGDGNDGDCAFGFGEVTKTWNYDTASSREADYALLYEGDRHQRDGGSGDFSQNIEIYNRMCASGTNSNNGYGLVNPDSNFSNYPIKSAVCESSNYTASGGGNTVIGTHDIFLDERSGADTAHRDTVEDGSNNTTHTILKYHEVSMAMKHL